MKSWPQIVSRLLDLGVIGINLEDQVVKGEGLNGSRQAGRIAAIREVAEQKRVPLFINARTDVFHVQNRPSAKSVREALDRARAYRQLGCGSQ